jgi:hypothetical protein
MHRDDQYPDYVSLEERIRAARAERSIALGFAIGDALASLWLVLTSFQRPRARGARAPSPSTAPTSGRSSAM